MSHSPKQLLNITQTSLGAAFNAVTGAAEQEVTGLRVSLPIIPKICTVKIILKAYLGTVAGDNTIRVRAGTSTSYLTNGEHDNLYVGGAKTLENFFGIVVENFDLSTQTYVVISVQNGTDALGMFMSASGRRCNVLTEVYG